MADTLRDIVERSHDLYTFTITKNDCFDRSTWEYRVTDRRSPMLGVSGQMKNLKYRIVTLRRGEHFFVAYRIGDSYFVDIRKSSHRTSVRKYVESLVNFYMKSNDISYRKNDSSFRVSELRMKSLGIDNFLDLCNHFREYSAVGIGLTRDVRNLIVLDIDVDCRKNENREELDRILMLFSDNNILPDFEIHNNDNGHIQLQWLIAPYRYKWRDDMQVEELISKLESDKCVNREIGRTVIDGRFLKESEGSAEYKTLTKALTDISDKPKFGDRKFTFWKAKNPFTALFRLQNLELSMPRKDGSSIRYLSQDEMFSFLSSKESRASYFSNARSFENVLEMMEPIVSGYMESEMAAQAGISDDDETFFDSDYGTIQRGTGDDSRDNFVFSRTKTATWDTCRGMGLMSSEDIARMPEKELKGLEKKIHKMVKEEYDSLNKKYGGLWPGTSNNSPFSKKEFESAFRMAFDFAKCKFSNITRYTDEQRERSIAERGLRKDMKMILVDYYMTNNKGLSREGLLNLVNKTLEKSKKKKISLSSLKRYISESRAMSDDDRKTLYSSYYENVKKRRDKVDGTSRKQSGLKKSRKRMLDSISINIVDEIMKNIEN